MKDLQLTVVTPSRWLAQCAASSPLLSDHPEEIIPNGIDTHLFKPVEPHWARTILGLPRDGRIILTGAFDTVGNPRKGFHHLIEALKSLNSAGWHEEALVAVFGALEPSDAPDIGLKTSFLGYFTDEISLALLYSAAYVFVTPAIQENLGNTVIEAMACGTPIVAFSIGGMPDMIVHHINGYLAKPFSTDDLAKGIAWVLDDESRRQELSVRSREKVENDFALEKVTRRYITLYEGILERSRARKSERLLT